MKEQVKFGNFVFDVEGLVDSWDPSSLEGVYAITYIPYPITKPDDHVPLYFGQTGNFRDRRIGSGHDGYNCAKRQVGNKPLYICTLKVEHDDMRMLIENLLRKKIKTPCNKN